MTDKYYCIELNDKKSVSFKDKIISNPMLLGNTTITVVDRSHGYITRNTGIQSIICDSRTNDDWITEIYLRKDVYDWIVKNIAQIDWIIEYGINFKSDTDNMAYKQRWM